MPDTISTLRPAPRASLACAVLAFGLLVFAAPATAQNPPKSTPPSPTGPPEAKEKGTGTAPLPGLSLGRFLVGDVAPDVNLNDAAGAPFHLVVERRSRPCLLVFVRRPQETVDVESAAEDLAALGLGTVIIAPFGPDKQRAWVARPRLRLLFDRASMTARTYGVFDAVTSNPRPGAFLVDRRGRIAWMVSGGVPSGPELVRMTREALEAQEEKPTAAGTAE